MSRDCPTLQSLPSKGHLKDTARHGKSRTVFSAASSSASLGGGRMIGSGDEPLPPLLLTLPLFAAAWPRLAPLLLLLDAVSSPLLLRLLAVLLPAQVGYSNWSRKLPSTMYGRCAAASRVRISTLIIAGPSAACGGPAAKRRGRLTRSNCRPAWMAVAVVLTSRPNFTEWLRAQVRTCGRKNMSPPPDPADTARPNRRTEPRPAVHSPAMARSVDVLPAPEGPTTSSDCPARTWPSSVRNQINHMHEALHSIINARLELITGGRATSSAFAKASSSTGERGLS